jgi:hypothetical protein
MDPATSNTVIAIATAVNVVVTTIYAIFTWRLWQETRRQAVLTGQQAAPDPRDVRGHAPALDLDRAVPAVRVRGLQRSAGLQVAESREQCPCRGSA